MSAKELKEALDGPARSLDAYLEARRESEIREDIRALCAIGPRAEFAAMAMQGLSANSIPGNHHSPGCIAKDACEIADALLAELAK